MRAGLGNLGVDVESCWMTQVQMFSKGEKDLSNVLLCCIVFPGMF